MESFKPSNCGRLKKSFDEILGAKEVPIDSVGGSAPDRNANIMPERVSVICPIYNGQRYLRESIDSVLAQTYSNFELLMWDDGSSDGSVAIAKSYIRDPRVRVFSNAKNRGLFPTLNEAIRAARGSIIRLWSQDDVMRPICLETEARYLDAHPDVPLAYSCYDVIDSEGLIQSKRPDIRGCHIKPPHCCMEIMFYHGSLTGNISNISVRRELFGEVGLFREDMIYAGDFEFLVRVARSHPMCCIFDRLLFLRKHSGQFAYSPWAYPHLMVETEEIFALIASFLSGGLAQRERRLLEYHWFNFRRQRLHHIVRRAISGDIKGAKQIYTLFSKQRGNHTLSLAVLYLLTLNGRWRPNRFKPSYSTEVAREIAFDSGWQHGLHGPHYSELSLHQLSMSERFRVSHLQEHSS